MAMRRLAPEPDYPPPEGLSPASEGLWRALVPAKARSGGRLALLEEALHARDRAASARALLAREGLVAESHGKMPHAHPAIGIERDAVTQFAALWHALALAFDQKVDGARW